MEALIYEQYGGPEELKIIAASPPSLSDSNAIVRVKAFSINPRDVSLREGRFKLFTGSTFPKLTGADFSGVIENINDGASFKKGDEVFGYIQDFKHGASAEMIAVPVKYLAKKPKEISHEVASTLGCAYLTALQGLRDKLKIQKDDRVLIFGASGGVGTAAIQLAKLMGAKVCAVSHSKNESHCLAQGADRFKAYDKGDVISSEPAYDAFFQVFSKDGHVYRDAKRLLKPDGRFLCLIPNPVFVAKKIFSRPHFDFMLVKSSKEDLVYMAALASSGKISPVISKRYSLHDAAEAYAMLEQHGAQGKIVIGIDR